MRQAHLGGDKLFVDYAGDTVPVIIDRQADLKNFFGSLSHEWVLRFVEHRVGDPRMISLIRRWLKAGILEDVLGGAGPVRLPAAPVHLHGAVEFVLYPDFP
jgi:hypothetical protein